jgi:hypothetical protein
MTDPPPRRPRLSESIIDDVYEHGSCHFCMLPFNGPFCSGRTAAISASTTSLELVLAAAAAADDLVIVADVNDAAGSAAVAAAAAAAGASLSSQTASGAGAYLFVHETASEAKTAARLRSFNWRCVERVMKKQASKTRQKLSKPKQNLSKKKRRQRQNCRLSALQLALVAEAWSLAARRDRAWTQSHPGHAV